MIKSTQSPMEGCLHNNNNKKNNNNEINEAPPNRHAIFNSLHLWSGVYLERVRLS